MEDILTGKDLEDVINRLPPGWEEIINRCCKERDALLVDVSETIGKLKRLCATLEESVIPTLEKPSAKRGAVGDWLRRMGDPQTGQARLVGLGQVRDGLNARLLRRDGHETYTLDVDATLIEGEKRDAHWSYQGGRG